MLHAINSETVPGTKPRKLCRTQCYYVHATEVLAPCDLVMDFRTREKQPERRIGPLACFPVTLERAGKPDDFVPPLISETELLHWKRAHFGSIKDRKYSEGFFTDTSNTLSLSNGNLPRENRWLTAGAAAEAPGPRPQPAFPARVTALLWASPCCPTASEPPSFPWSEHRLQVHRDLGVSHSSFQGPS